MASPSPAGTVPRIAASDLRDRIGETFLSPWFEVDQERVNGFAGLTLDDYWIHVDIDRARREIGGTIAHGFLILSLFAPLSAGAVEVTGFRTSFNYGFDNVRFTSPVIVGSRIRMAVAIAGVTDKPDGSILLRRDCRIEIEGADRPAVVAEWLALFQRL